MRLEVGAVILLTISSSFTVSSHLLSDDIHEALADKVLQRITGNKDIDWRVIQNFLTPLDGGISEQCRKDSETYMYWLNNNLTLLTDNGWAYKMFDASVKMPPSSLLQGNVKRIGAFESCKEVQAKTFRGKHCMVSLAPPVYDFGGGDEEKSLDLEKHISTFAGPEQAPMSRGIALYAFVAFGRCIPDSCTEEDITTSFTYFMEQQLGSALPVYTTSCHTADEEIPLDGKDWAFISVLLFFGILIVIGTIIDISIKYLDAGFYNQKIVQIFQGFSFYRNTLKIFNTDTRKDTITCINGIRFLSMTWVLFGHAYSSFQGPLPTTNTIVLFDPDGPLQGNVAFQAIENAFPSVDSFFLIGATLLTYSTLKQLDKLKGGDLKFWIMFYIHRYLRLTCVYGMVIFFVATLLRQFLVGPQSALLEAEVIGCQESWWYNLLYINNFQFQIDDSSAFCVGQSWYLANDMQFFVISPIFIFALWKNKVIGLLLVGAGIVVASVVPIVLSAQHDYPISFSFMTTDFSFFTDYYIIPWCRFQPFIFGILLGYVLHNMRDIPKLKINPYFSIWIWAITGAVGAVIIYGLYPYFDGFYENFLDPEYKPTSTALSAAYNGLHRLAWAVCLGWVILACTKGAGGPINSILSWPAWIPLANLSYCIYLVHIAIISYFGSMFTFSITFTHVLGVYWSLSMLCFSIFVAFLFAVIFELPMAHLERILFASIGIGTFPEVKKT